MARHAGGRALLGQDQPNNVAIVARCVSPGITHDASRGRPCTPCLPCHPAHAALHLLGCPSLAPALQIKYRIGTSAGKMPDADSCAFDIEYQAYLKQVLARADAEAGCCLTFAGAATAESDEAEEEEAEEEGSSQPF